MRIFIMRARKAVTEPNFKMERLPKEGKMDTVCAAIANSIWIANDMRRDVVFHAVLEGPPYGPKVITFRGADMKGMWHDERSVAIYIKDALRRGRELSLNEETKVRVGVFVAKKSFERLVWEYAKKGMQLVVLDEKGEDVRKFPFAKDCVVIFGDPVGLPDKVEQFMKQFSASKVSLGPRIVFSSHCPIIVNNELDRRSLQNEKN